MLEQRSVIPLKIIAFYVSDPTLILLAGKNLKQLNPVMKRNILEDYACDEKAN